MAVGTSDERDLLFMADCVQACLDCGRCNYVTFSRYERECVWSNACELDRLLTDVPFTKFRTRRVRRAGGDATWPTTRLLEWRSAQPRRSTMRPRVVDVVNYGGPAHDAVLELRMRELSAHVGLFVIIEHARPPAVPLSRRFDKGAARFAPFAARVHVVRRETRMDEFLEYDHQNYVSRRASQEAWQEAFAEVARPGDLVIAGHLDHVPQAAALRRLLRDAAVLRELADGTSLKLEGRTYVYHLRCEHPRGAGLPTTLLSGETLLHCGGVSVQDYAGENGRCVERRVADAAWHLMYFAPAQQIHEHACQKRWATNYRGMDAPALCRAPASIAAAVRGCADLWDPKRKFRARDEPPPARPILASSDAAPFVALGAEHRLDEARAHAYAAAQAARRRRAARIRTRS